jgi:hypothetical protein
MMPHISLEPARCHCALVKTRTLILPLILLIGFFGQGCVVWIYTDTPPVSGTVIDSATKLPIAGAKVGFKEHERLGTLSASDGSFDAPATYVLRPCFILPGELWRSSGILVIQAPGYTLFEQGISTSMGAPYTMMQPVFLKKDSQ